MPMRSRLVLFLMALLLTLLSVQVLAQTDQYPLSQHIELANADAFESFALNLDEEAMLSISMIPADGTTGRARILVIDDERLILSESLADRSENLADGANLKIPLLAGEYEIITTLVENNDISSGTFDIEIELLEETEAELFDVSEERLAEIGYPSIEPNEPATWTIFAYYGADTDLEQAIIEDTNEFEIAGGSDENVRVLVLLDRTPEYSDIDDDWSTTRLYEIGPDGLESMEDMIAIDSEPLAEFEELDMGSAETLAAFLTWGIQHYPAENYVLAFGSHGAGWRGVIVDETDSNNSLTMPELRRAFDTVRAETGFDSFDLLVNDACLMASIEYYDVMQDYFNLSLGSAELVTNPALDMTTLTSSLRAQLEAGETNLDEVGRILVDQYILVDSVAKSPISNFTEALTDLERFNQVNAALDNFAAVINENPRLHVPTLTQARANTYTYNRLFGATTQVDLGDFMEQIIFVSTDFDVLIPAAQDVIDALGNVRVYGNAGSFAIERTSYYNIFFPLEASELQNYFGVTGLDSWEQVLITYFAYSRFEFWSEASDGVPFHQPQTPVLNITGTRPDNSVASFNLPIAVDIEVQATNVSRGIFFVEQVIDDNTSLRLLANPMLQDVPAPNLLEPLRNQNVWHSGVDLRTVKWNAAAYVLTDGVQENVEFLQQTFDDSGSFFLEGRYRRTPDDNWLDVKVTFTGDPLREFDLRSSTFISINEQAGTFGVFEPEPGAELQVFRTEVDLDDGDVDIEEDGNIYQITESGLGATLSPIESGDYVLRFRIEAFGQDYVEAQESIVVDNDNIDGDWRGQNFIRSFGFTAGLPVWWGLDFASSIGVLSADVIAVTPRAGSPYSASVINVYDYPGLSNLDEARERYMSILARPESPVEFSNTFTIDGREVSEFRYTINDRTVHAIATYDAVRDMALIFAIDQRSGDPEMADALFAEFIAHLNFYDDLPATTEANWQYQNIGIEQSLAVPANWVQVEEENAWITFHSPDDEHFRVSLQTVDLVDFDIVEFAEINLDGIDVGENLPRIYSGENYLWESIQFTVTDSTGTSIGRLYKTTQNDASYMVLVESPADTAADNFIALNTIISSIVIEDLYFSYDMLNSLGVRLEISNPILTSNPFRPMRQSTRTGTDIVFVQSPRTDKQIEMFLVPGVELDGATIWFANYWENQNTPYELTNFEFIEVADQRAIELELTITLNGFNWRGKYFAVYSEVDDLLYLIGVRSLGTTDIEADYTHLRDSIAFNFGNFDLYTSIQNRPLYDPLYAIDVDVWQASEPMQITRNFLPQVDFLGFVDDQFQIAIYNVYGATTPDLDAELRRVGLMGDWFTITSTDPIDNRPAVELSGYGLQFFAVYDEERSRIVMVGGLNYLTYDDSFAPIYERLKESFTIIPDD